MEEPTEEQESQSSPSPKAGSRTDLRELILRIEGEIERRTSPEYAESGEGFGIIESAVFAEKQYIKFYLGDISLVVPITGALEIGRLPEVTVLPNLPVWILGISNIRGEIVSIIDLKGFLEWPGQKQNRNPHFIIIHNKEMKVGCVVDRIMGIVSMNEDDAVLENNLQEKTSEEVKLEPYISEVSVKEAETLYVLDVDKLLSDPRMRRENASEFR